MNVLEKHCMYNIMLMKWERTVESWFFVASCDYLNMSTLKAYHWKAVRRAEDGRPMWW